MAKILVADDNSNIQKMVGLALKDQGIDVVAVGNGEAAVRKISDVRPDLVLADVFMPVRNGYEVCKYVKNDSSLSHIPVILLVGAFDPLDEQEAQRVGADGVLKKPFVPPDPLISMVKSALVRASTGNLNSPKPSNNSQTTATVTSLPNAPASMPTQVASEAESHAEQIPARPAELKIEPGTQAPAFGSLLETSPSGTAEDTGSFATTNPHVLERDWGGSQEEEEEEEEESSSAWRPDAVNEALAGEAEPATKKPEKKKREAWTPTREKKQDLLEGADEPQFVSEPLSAKPTPTKSSVPAPPSVATPPVSSTAAPPAANTAAPPAANTATPPAATATKPPVTSPSAPVTPTKPPVEIPSAKATGPSRAPGEVVPAAPPKQAATKEGEKSAGGGSWFSISSTPWEADAKQASQTAPAWNTPAAPATPVANAPVQPSGPTHAPAAPELAVPGVPELEPEPEATGFYTDTAALPELVSGGENISPAAIEALRQEATQVVEESTLQRVVESSPEYTLPTPEAPAPEAAPDMDALVAKVLAKLSPEVLQAVTREILKPVVEAMVRDEIKAKKS